MRASSPERRWPGGAAAPTRPRRRTGTALLLVAAFALPSCAGAPPAPSGPSEPEEISFAPELGVDLGTMERTGSGLYFRDIREGEGFTASRNSLVTLRYVGYLPDGTIFDTTGDGEPFQFRLGGSEVIRGWNQGIPGMKRGGLRRLVLRPSLAYGARGRGVIPPNATLVFDVQLLDVR